MKTNSTVNGEVVEKQACVNVMLDDGELLSFDQRFWKAIYDEFEVGQKVVVAKGNGWSDYKVTLQKPEVVLVTPSFGVTAAEANEIALIAARLPGEFARIETLIRAAAAEGKLDVTIDKGMTVGFDKYIRPVLIDKGFLIISVSNTQVRLKY